MEEPTVFLNGQSCDYTASTVATLVLQSIAYYQLSSNTQSTTDKSHEVLGRWLQSYEGLGKILTHPPVAVVSVKYRASPFVRRQA
ncbi:hypothetical protein KC221_22790, partial [Mycobacterium tuberculosis]|nr:hypothetical protein [Mycobacterium tuberculosis]